MGITSGCNVTRCNKCIVHTLRPASLHCEYQLFLLISVHRNQLLNLVMILMRERLYYSKFYTVNIQNFTQLIFKILHSNFQKFTWLMKKHNDNVKLQVLVA